MTRHCILAIALLVGPSGAMAYDYRAETGALSYRFFNLSPYTDCALTPHGAEPNDQAPAESLASFMGWNAYGGWAGFFKGDGGYSGDNNNPEELVMDNYIFWDTHNAVGQPPPAQSIDIGAFADTVEYGRDFDSYLNPPAIADSWTISCTGGTAFDIPDGGPVVLAAVASASNLLQSGGDADDDYPYSWSLSANWDNAAINPPSKGGDGQDNPSDSNPNGMGFTEGTLNFNPSSSSVGGLWLGVENANPNNLAVAAVNAAMYPVNLAAYGRTAMATCNGCSIPHRARPRSRRPCKPRPISRLPTPRSGARSSTA